MITVIHTWNDNVTVMRHEIFNYAGWIFDNIDVPPVDPLMLWPKCSIKEIVPCTADALPASALSLEAMSLRHVLEKIITKVLLNDGDAMTARWIGRRLYAFDFISEDLERVIPGVSY